MVYSNGSNALWTEFFRTLGDNSFGHYTKFQFYTVTYKLYVTLTLISTNVIRCLFTSLHIAIIISNNCTKNNDSSLALSETSF
jgi:hypothetical protein